MTHRVRTVSFAAVSPLLGAMAADDLDVRDGGGVWLAVGDDRPAGVAQVFDVGGHAVLDDVWVEPSARRAGIATSIVAAAREMRRPLWLICDEPDIAFYAGRGFTLVEPSAFPEPLARHYAAKDEWPRATDHEHYAMVAGA